MNRTKSKSLFAEAQKYLVGGVNSPVRAFRGVGGTPLKQTANTVTSVTFLSTTANNDIVVFNCIGW